MLPSESLFFLIRHRFICLGLYTGTAGVSYALYRLVESNLFPDKNESFLKAAKSYLNAALDSDNMKLVFLFPQIVVHFPG